MTYDVFNARTRLNQIKDRPQAMVGDLQEVLTIAHHALDELERRPDPDHSVQTLIEQRLSAAIDQMLAEAQVLEPLRMAIGNIKLDAVEISGKLEEAIEEGVNRYLGKLASEVASGLHTRALMDQIENELEVFTESLEIDIKVGRE